MESMHWSIPADANGVAEARRAAATSLHPYLAAREYQVLQLLLSGSSRTRSSTACRRSRSPCCWTAGGFVSRCTIAGPSSPASAPPRSRGTTPPPGCPACARPSTAPRADADWPSSRHWRTTGGSGSTAAASWSGSRWHGCHGPSRTTRRSSAPRLCSASASSCPGVVVPRDPRRATTDRGHSNGGRTGHDTVAIHPAAATAVSVHPPAVVRPGRPLPDCAPLRCSPAGCQLVLGRPPLSD